MARRGRRRPVGPIYTFAFVWMMMAGIFPIYRIWGLLLTVGGAFLAGKVAERIAMNKRSLQDEKTAPKQETAPKTETAPKSAPKKSYGPEIDPILEEGNRALAEMGRLYMSIKDPDVRQKINELMRVTDKITQDAIEDPADIPQIKKFMNYYLPTTIKLLNSYDRMGSQGISGENIDKSMDRINEMLDVAIDAYKKRLDSLYANNALDIETDIDVMNQMLAREGLTGGSDFSTASSGGTQAQALK